MSNDADGGWQTSAVAISCPEGTAKLSVTLTRQSNTPVALRSMSLQESLPPPY